MDLVAGVRFGNVIGSALFFRNGCDFRFCAVGVSAVTLTG